MNRNLCALGAMSVLGVVIGFGSKASAEVPSLLNHQGRLYDSSEQPVNGTVDMQFALYDAIDATTPIWIETHSVTFEGGYYSVALGDTNSLAAVVDGQ